MFVHTLIDDNRIYLQLKKKTLSCKICFFSDCKSGPQTASQPHTDLLYNGNYLQGKVFSSWSIFHMGLIGISNTLYYIIYGEFKKTRKIRKWRRFHAMFLILISSLEKYLFSHKTEVSTFISHIITFHSTMYF